MLRASGTALSMTRKAPRPLIGPCSASPGRKTWQTRCAGRSLAGAASAAGEHVYISQVFWNRRTKMAAPAAMTTRRKKSSPEYLRGRRHGEGKWFGANIEAGPVQRIKVEGARRPPVCAAEEGLVHGDLRVDNFLFGAQDTWVIDWPNACRGPLVFDLVFLSSNMEALGFAPAEKFFTDYAAQGCDRSRLATTNRCRDAGRFVGVFRRPGLSRCGRKNAPFALDAAVYVAGPIAILWPARLGIIRSPAVNERLKINRVVAIFTQIILFLWFIYSAII